MIPGTGHKWSGLRISAGAKAGEGMHPGEAGPLPIRMLWCGAQSIQDRTFQQW